MNASRVSQTRAADPDPTLEYNTVCIFLLDPDLICEKNADLNPDQTLQEIRIRIRPRNPDPVLKYSRKKYESGSDPRKIKYQKKGSDYT